MTGIATAGLRKQLVNAVLGSVGVRILGMAVTFASGAILARHLGPREYGAYGTGIALAAVLIVFSQAGLPQLITREMSRFAFGLEAGKARTALLWFAAFVIGAGALTMACVLALTSAFPSLSLSVPRATLFWAGLLIPITALSNVGTGALRGLHRPVAAQFQDYLLRPAIFGALIVGAIMLSAAGLDATKAIALQVAAGGLGAAICAANLVADTPSGFWPSRARPTPLDWARSAMSMAFTDLIRVVDGQYATFVIGILLTLHDVGQYRVAMAAAAVAGLPISIVSLAFMSHLSALHAAGDNLRLQRLVATAAVLATLGAGALTVAFLLFGEPLIVATFGAAYLPAWSSMAIICCAYLVGACFAGSAVLLNMCGLERQLANIYLGGLVASLATSWILMPRIGFVGAAVGVLVGEIVRGFAMRHVALAKLGIETSLLSAPGAFSSFALPSIRRKPTP